MRWRQHTIRGTIRKLPEVIKSLQASLEEQEVARKLLVNQKLMKTRATSTSPLELIETREQRVEISEEDI